MADKQATLQAILDVGVMPVVRATSAAQAMEIAEAIKAGGVNCIEITMTVPGAIKVMEGVADKYGKEVLLGAGTVLDAETARACILAGAEFIVGPGLDLRMVEVVLRYGKIIVPGALSPTEVIKAWSAGADLVKIFPAGNVGGPAYIKALKGPLPHIPMVPTGGVNLKTAGEFIKAGAAALAAGSALVDKKAVTEGNWDVVSENAKKFVEEVKKARAEMG